MDPVTATTETAKAVGEVAKTTGKGIEAAAAMGGFIAKYIHGALEQGMGIFEDKLRYTRWERQVRLIHTAEQFLAEQGLKRPPNGVELKFAVPLLQAATLEEDDYLQDLWARLLVNAAVNPNVAMKRAFISMLENMSNTDVHVLMQLHSANAGAHEPVVTSDLPEATHTWVPKDSLPPQPSEDILFSLGNLARLGAVTGTSMAGGGTSWAMVHLTVLGRGLINACSPPAPAV